MPAPGKLEYALLTHLACGPGETPLGIGTMTMTKLLSNGWATPHLVPGSKERLYAITEAGRLVMESYKPTAG